MVDNPKGSAQNGRALVAMFGLNRFAEKTEQTIIDNILVPLQASFDTIDVVAHFNVPSHISNPRSGEQTPRFTSSDFRTITFKKIVMEPQSTETDPDMFDRLSSVPLYKEADEGGASRRNIGHQLHSLKMLSQMALDRGQVYDLYVILRPDLIYHEPLRQFDIDAIIRHKCDIMVPRWQSSGGINDRFCIANRAGAIAYMNRANYVDRFCSEHKYIHSERLLHYAVAREHLKVGYMTMTASRVRSGGAIHRENFKDGWRQVVKRIVRRAKVLVG
jgi:hypothetical protein